MQETVNEIGTEAFDFGENWKNFVENAQSQEELENAKRDFQQLFRKVDLKGKDFLDIGFGQGNVLLLSTSLGANAHGNDINPKSKESFELNAEKYFTETVERKKIPLCIGSILLDETIQELKTFTSSGTYDIVHSWGVLHHTGDMWKAINSSAELVKDNGHFVIAIYNKHWSSKPWWLIKKLYVKSPGFIKKLMVWFFFAVIYVAKFLVTWKNPMNKERGMNFYYDVVDWVGGFPYEYASKEEITDFMKERNFKLIDFFKSPTATGCYEFVFEKI